MFEENSNFSGGGAVFLILAIVFVCFDTYTTEIEHEEYYDLNNQYNGISETVNITIENQWVESTWDYTYRYITYKTENGDVRTLDHSRYMNIYYMLEEGDTCTALIENGYIIDVSNHYINPYVDDSRVFVTITDKYYNENDDSYHVIFLDDTGDYHNINSLDVYNKVEIGEVHKISTGTITITFEDI